MHLSPDTVDIDIPKMTTIMEVRIIEHSCPLVAFLFIGLAIRVTFLIGIDAMNCETDWDHRVQTCDPIQFEACSLARIGFSSMPKTKPSLAALLLLLCRDITRFGFVRSIFPPV